jgi:hypothetical protein
MELRLDRLVGRMVMTANHRRLGRIEEIRADKHGSGCVVAAYVLGRAGLAERLGVGLRLLVGHGRRAGYIARWDQLDVSDVTRPRLRCPVDELVRE